GREIYIEGRIDNRSYDDKDGNKRYISEVVVENFRFIGSRVDVPNGEAAPIPAGAEPPTPDAGGGGDEDLPF
ncbi:MAG: single-stranded DNA-binding protein, partial [Candidatus Zixiibacteriota bacterium]